MKAVFFIRSFNINFYAAIRTYFGMGDFCIII